MHLKRKKEFLFYISPSPSTNLLLSHIFLAAQKRKKKWETILLYFIFYIMKNNTFLQKWFIESNLYVKLFYIFVIVNILHSHFSPSFSFKLVYFSSCKKMRGLSRGRAFGWTWEVLSIQSNQQWIKSSKAFHWYPPKSSTIISGHSQNNIKKYEI